jgi:hypothetical protein
MTLLKILSFSTNQNAHQRFLSQQPLIQFSQFQFHSFNWYYLNQLTQCYFTTILKPPKSYSKIQFIWAKELNLR